jgi:two-component sensor histidine kinase
MAPDTMSPDLTPIADGGEATDWTSQRSRAVDYFAAFALFVAALAARLILDGWLPPGFPYLTFFPAIVLAAYFLGTGPGLLCAVASGLAAWYIFLPPFYSFTLTWQATLALGFFIFIAGVDIFLIDRMMRAKLSLATSRARAIELARQRDEMFSELQHRVGNNLAMTAAMLNVQARAANDPGVQQALRDASRRISVIADINRTLLSENASSRVVDDAFVHELASKCLAANAVDRRIAVETQIESIVLDQNRVLPVALVLIEAISNAVEHGFGETDQGRVRVTGRVDKHDYVLEVADTGRGLPASFDMATTRSTGLKLVRSFASQIGGTFDIRNGAGAVSRLAFPLKTS